ncbi:MAG: SDR family oxidoreductase [Bacteroidota bacterium]
MAPDFDLSGKVIAITGGSGVLAARMAESMARAGARIGLLDIRPDAANALAEKLRSIGADVLVCETDVLDRSSLEKALANILQHWQSVDVLINAAGGNLAGATISPEQDVFSLSMPDFSAVTRLNLDGTVLPSLVFGAQMAKQQKGVIINVSSMTASRAITRVVGYSAAKAAVENFTRWMAVEMALKFGEGLRVNAIAPGFFIGEQNRRLLLKENGELTERGETIIRQTPMKRFGEAEELCGTIQWLASEASRFVTGVVIPIDGGFSAFSGV